MTGVLFLDIDGVLNSDRFRYEQPWGTLERNMIDPVAVAMVNAITERWELRIVVSSSWRIMVDVDAILRARGVQAEILGHTPFLATPRGTEIGAWLAEHSEVTHYVILDDNVDMGEHLDHLVRTDARYGLQPEAIERVAAVLELQRV